MGVELGRQVF